MPAGTSATPVPSPSPSAAFGVAPNPHLAASAWPIFHANNYAQASVAGRGIEPGDLTEAQHLETPGKLVSPWTILGPVFPGGQQAAYGSSQTHVFKTVLDGPRFTMAGTLDLDRRKSAYDWYLFMLDDGRIVTTDKARNEIVFVADTNPSDPYSALKVVKRVRIPAGIGALGSHMSLSYDDKIIFTTQDAYIGALDPDDDTVVTYNLGLASGDLNLHNAFAIDEHNSIYMVSETAMTRIDWNGRAFSIAWRAPYDFVGPGCEGVDRSRVGAALAVASGLKCTGSGTTPTLIGTRADGVVIVNDGHSPTNNAVAFWRDAPPAGWQAVPGRDPRVAGVAALPYSTPDGGGFTNENSPTAGGLGFASAQWNGFSPACDPLKGVQKFVWNAVARRLEQAWATAAVNMNGVLTYANGSGLVYQSGRSACTYRLYGLDWATGAVRVDIPLGTDERWLDQGNSIVPTADRSLVFGSATGIVRVRVRDR